MHMQSRKLQFRCRSGRNLLSFAHCARVNICHICAKLRYSNRMDKQRGFSYTEKCKRKVILLVETEGNRHAAQEFPVPESNVRLWPKKRIQYSLANNPRRNSWVLTKEDIQRWTAKCDSFCWKDWKMACQWLVTSSEKRQMKWLEHGIYRNTCSR